METQNIEISRMLVVYALLVIPIILFQIFSIGQIKKLIIAVVRMTIQLTLVGIYLRYIFEWNNILLNIGWVLVMMTVANTQTLKGASISLRTFFPTSFLSIFIGTALVSIVFIGIAISPSPIYDARYLVPIAGMILGNCLRSNVIVLERFFSGVRENPKEWQTYLSLGATKLEAVRPYMQKAIKASLSPALTTMTTMGIVSLPGMMTGQILGGSVPFVAIKYQIAIMICIFTASSVTSTLNVLLGLKIGFDSFGNLKDTAVT